ncbi:glycoside hydrolase family 95 protein [Amycolatopsis sp. NPDC050768]|uniref:glycoside hydrolase family 95 protein n=1 Tax=Amycolatopsis sp. NPDC050768 TaxID=3154839 RepID=UPI0033D9C79C
MSSPGFSRRSLLGAAMAGGALALTTAALGRVTAAAAPGARPVPDSVLWFDEPATIWQEQAFPVGNGAAGAMIYGTVESEQIQFNHDTLWNGGPGSHDEGHEYNFGNWYEARPTALAGVRATIAATGSADTGPATAALGQTKWGYGAYQTFGDLFLDRATPAGAVTGYRRQLDLATGLATVGFTTADGVTHTRELFASFPDHVIVTRLSASRGGQVSFTARLSTADNRTVTYSAKDGRITMRGALTDNGLVFEAQVQVIAEGGRVTTDAAGRVTVTGADAATLVLAPGTDYAPVYPHYRGVDPHRAATSTVDAAVHRGHRALRERHLADHRELFDRVRIDLGQQPTTVPTDEALQEFKQARNQGQISADPQLEMLHFQIGRYLLIGSSREGSRPANLQGVWNDSTSPDWQSDYTTNINLEMNYWPSDVTNLAETVPPLVDFIDGLRAPGRVTARDLCGVPQGFAAMSHVNVFGYTGVSTNAATWAPESTAWLIRQLWEHYLFTMDEDFLRRRAYPILKEHTQFWLGYLVTDADGTLVVSPSFSPELGPFTAGATYSQTIVWDLFTNTLAAAKIVGDHAYRPSLEKTLAKLDPGLRIGSWGQLQEWKTDLDEPDSGHRHMSFSYPLFPGHQITAEATPEFYEAARVAVEARTAHTAQNDIGWNRAQKINAFARLRNGDQAREQLDHLLWRNTFANFLNDWPFQIDGNFGVASGVAEMLLQSHAGFVEVLPALPTGWASGSFRGLRARGAFTVNAWWTAGQVTKVEVTSDVGGDLKLRTASLGGGARVHAVGGPTPHYTTHAGELLMPTRRGATYTVTPA